MGLVHSLRAVTVEFDLPGAEFAARHGLHPTDVRALIHLLDAARAGTRATPGRLGGQLRLNSSGTTALVDRLERLGWVRRSRDTADRRRVLLEVEEEAIQLGWTFFGPVIGEVVTAAEGFQEGELETVRRFPASVLESTRRALSA
ncbi:MarR family winged helix-turn-helix transcriptional regulator [Streptomyces sp. NPDC051740]|uniref:MarR family winged helix-turn-helix transcriptional regulator n=1 Tax=Streptomyces sp. NPDC051740 TaxID=3365673 RepID=UPI0037930C4E